MNSCQGSFCKRVEECCGFPFLCLMRRKFWALLICLLRSRPSRNPNHGIEFHPQEHQKSGAEIRISSKKHQFLKHQRRCWQQISKIGEKSERERKFNIASKTACRGFKSFCPCHRSRSPQTPKFGVCGLFLCQNRPNGHALKIPDFRGEILQTPQYSWIFQRLPSGTSSKKHQPVSGKGRSCTVCRGEGTGGEKKCIFFVQPCCVDKNRWSAWLWLAGVIKWK